MPPLELEALAERVLPGTLAASPLTPLPATWTAAAAVVQPAPSFTVSYGSFATLTLDN